MFLLEYNDLWGDASKKHFQNDKTPYESMKIMKACIVTCFLFLFTLTVIPAAVVDLSVPIGSQPGISEHLVLYYNLDTVTEGVVTDGATDPHNGTLVQGGATQLPSLADGVNVSGTNGYNQSLYFKNGFSSATPQSSVQASTGTGSSAFNLVNTSFTIGAWITMDSVDLGAAQKFSLVDKQGASSNNGYSLDFEKDTLGNWTMTLYVTGGGNVYRSKSPVLSDLGNGDWHHVAVVFDYHTGDSSASFWLDGVEYAGTSIGGNDFADAVVGNNTAAVWVGQRNHATTGSQFDGRIDDLFIADTALSFTAPIPEPTSGVLLGGALLVAGGYRRFFRRTR